MGDGRWFFYLVRRNGRHRRLARVLCLARRATHAGDWRIGRLSLLREDARAPRSGSWPWIRKRADRCRSWMRPGPGHIFWWYARGALRMASLLHCPAPQQHGVADSLVPVDTARRHCDFAHREGRPRISRTPEKTLDVGNLRRPVRRKLRAVFRDHLAAVLSGTGAAPFHEHHGENWRRRIFVLLGCRSGFWLDL